MNYTEKFLIPRSALRPMDVGAEGPLEGHEGLWGPEGAPAL